MCNKWSGNMNATFSDTWLVHGHIISFVIFFCVCVCKLLPISSWFLKSKCQSQDTLLYWNWVLQKLYCNYLAVDGALFVTQSFASMHTMAIFGKLSQFMYLKGQETSDGQIVVSSIPSKNQRKVFLISALASEIGRIKKNKGTIL